MARMGSAFKRKIAQVCRRCRDRNRNETQNRVALPIENPWDANPLHISYEGRHLEDPNAEPEASMWRWTVSPEEAPDQAEYLDIEFEKGDIVALNGKRMTPATVLTELNRLGSKHGIGRLDAGRESLCRHEIPWLLRNTGRNDHAEGASCHRIAHTGP